MIDYAQLPALNGIAAILLTAGFIFIRRREIARHRACMLAAFVTSALFLTSYVIYHLHVGSVPFRGKGPIRAVYLAILGTHVVLAATILPLARFVIHWMVYQLY